MDIFSHGLWAGAAAKAANKISSRGDSLPASGRLTEGGGDSSRREVSPPCSSKLNVWHAAAWGVFPDLFAFTPAFIGLFWLLATGQMSLSEWPGRHGGEPSPGDSLPVFQLAGQLYNFSHSIFVFAIVFCIVWFMRKKPVLEMGGWLLHIIMDIPTHSYAFYPTPVFWPLFGWKFNGIQWAQPWFLILDYGLLILVYWLLREKKIK
ncbi:MAG: hypothetical protein Q7S01_00815 [bacterium]|nr:hypothetical protein [bacterium]